jgi:uncharacterized protein involved in exopolysaccharide biosynthesis
MPESSAPENASRKILTRLAVRTVLIGTLAAVVTAAISMTFDNQYRATATLLLAPLPLYQARAAEGGNAALGTDVSSLMVKPLEVQEYQELLMSDEIVASLRDTLATLNGEGNGIALEQMRNAMHIETRVLKKTVYDVVFQPFLDLHVTMPSPEIAAALANEWARLGVELSGQLATKGKEGLILFLGEQFGEKELELREAERVIEELDGEMVLADWQARLSALEEYATTLQMDCGILAAEVAHAQGRAEELGNQLVAIPEKATLRKALPDDAYWLLKDQGKPADPSRVLVTEEANPAHAYVLQEHAAALSLQKGLEREMTAKAARLAEVRDECAALRLRVASHARLLTEAERKRDALVVQYEQLATHYGAAQIAEAQDTPDLKLIADSVPPDSKIGPHRSMLVLAALVLGMMVPLLHFLMMQTLALYSQRLDAYLAAGKTD